MKQKEERNVQVKVKRKRKKKAHVKVKHKKKGSNQVKVKKRKGKKEYVKVKKKRKYIKTEKEKEMAVCCGSSLVVLSTISKAPSCRLHLKAMSWYMEKIYMMALLYPFCIKCKSSYFFLFFWL